MSEILVTESGEEITVYNIDDFPYDELECEIIKDKKRYLCSDFMTFDIETTTFLDREKNTYTGFMYHWQANLFGINIFGRRWEEFMTFLDNVKSELNLNQKKHLVVYVHNLAFEFQFIKDLFFINSLFARESHKVIKCLLDDCFEFRCSYFLSNMSLAKFCQSSRLCTHYKLIDQFVYRKWRTPETPLIPTEKLYCLYDALGLRECIQSRLLDYGDDLKTIPLTSTGYIRRIYRDNVQSNKANREQFLDMRMSLEELEICKECFRGGDCHASRFYAGQILEDVDSWDKKSSYIESMYNGKYPVKAWKTYDLSERQIIEMTENYCIMFFAQFKNIYTEHPFPYIPLAKCYLYSKDYDNDNGRILRAEHIGLWLTELDFEIIRKTYKWEDIYINKSYVALAGSLNNEILITAHEFFYNKTTLEDSDPYMYMKAKNGLNSSYGCMVTYPLQTDIDYQPSTMMWLKSQKDKKLMLDKFYSSRKSFLSYQQGLYVPANARYALWRGIFEIDEMDLVYIDTDSIKHLGSQEEVFARINKEIIKKDEETGAYCDYNGKRYYLGLWEHETVKKGRYEKFLTYGAKKYGYEQKGKFTCTVSGMNKKKGSERIGKIENFRLGQTYHDVGRTVSYYNDTGLEMRTLPDGCKILTASNIGVVDTTYTLGITHEYFEILDDIECQKNLSKNIDNKKKL